MEATPLSSEHYYPMLLSNGRDAVFIDYGGSHFISRNGHSHLHQHEGVPCGWYKAAHRVKTKTQPIQSIAAAGIQLHLFGAPAEPRFYAQTFHPETATLLTVLDFYTDIRISIENFLNDRSMWCQTVTVLQCPPERDISIGFMISAPFSGSSVLALPSPFTFKCAAESPDRIVFDYETGGIQGGGFLQADRPFDEIHSPGDRHASCEGRYIHAKEGFVASRVMSCADDSEGESYADALRERLRMAGTGLRGLREEHLREWQQYFSTSRIDIPDKKLEYLYNVSRYVIRASQHPESGLFGLGLLPNLWGGALYDYFDSWYSHVAMLSAGNLQEAEFYLKSFGKVAPVGRKALAKLNLPGVAFSGWDDCCGNFLRDDYSAWVTEEKPCFSAYMIIAAYDQWRYMPESLTPEVKGLIREVIAFLRAVMICEDGDSVSIKEVAAGTEAGFLVKVDTFNQLVVGKALSSAGTMLEDDRLARMGRKLIEGLSVNYREDGVLMPFQDAPYTGGMQLIYYLLSLPEEMAIVSVEKTLLAGKTVWGTNFEQTTEEYRHWPWIDAHAVICYAHAGMSESAMPYLIHQSCGASSLGAIPEKIRLDGSIVKYWYSSPHALVVWSLNDAFAHSDTEDEIRLAFGFHAPFADFACEGIRMPGGLLVSYRVSDRRLIRLRVENVAARDRRVRVLLNSFYMLPDVVKEIQIGANDVLEWGA